MKQFSRTNGWSHFHLRLLLVAASMLLPTGATATAFFDAYKPNYVLFGPDGGTGSECDIKFQLSFKQRLSRSEKINRVIDRFYFGFTQRSFWDICQSSAPFRETNYAPELFYTQKFGRNSALEARSVQAGFVHESNGREGEASRSWNRAYVEGVLAYNNDLLSLPPSLLGTENGNHFGDEDFLSFRARAWATTDKDSSTQDISNFVGHTEFQLKATTQAEQLSVTGHIGDGFDNGNISVDLTLKALPPIDKIPIFPSKDNSYFWHAQYFYGYGDELIKFDVRDEVVRLGLLFTY